MKNTESNEHLLKLITVNTLMNVPNKFISLFYFQPKLSKLYFFIFFYFFNFSMVPSFLSQSLIHPYLMEKYNLVDLF